MEKTKLMFAATIYDGWNGCYYEFTGYAKDEEEAMFFVEEYLEEINGEEEGGYFVLDNMDVFE